MPGGAAMTVNECAGGTNPCGNGTCVDSQGPGYACACERGFVSNGAALPSCVFEDECSTGQHGCGTTGGSCLNGAALGYACTCAAGFTDSGGIFPDCFKSGTTVLTAADASIGTSTFEFDFSKGAYAQVVTEGDFYASRDDYYDPTSRIQFFANNLGQRGVAPATSTSSNLLDVPMPPVDAFTIFGVPVVLGNTYVALAEVPEDEPSEDGYVIIFRVTALEGSNVTLDYVYAYRPETTLAHLGL